MSTLLSTIYRSTTKSVFVRQAQSIARLNVCGSSGHPILANNYQRKFQATKLDSKLIKPFSTTSNADSVSAAAHDHSRLWTLERAVSVALIAVTPLAFITPNPYLDYALALSMVTHVHWGLEAIVVDYVRPKIFGPIIPKVAIALTYLLSILTLIGLYQFNYNDVGLSQAITMFLKK